MKEYKVEVDITVSKALYVKAENEEEAKAEVRKMMEHPDYYYSKCDYCVGYEITDIEEDED